MKLQFAFGNPRKGKRKKKVRKSVAKRRKSRKTVSVKSKLKKAVKFMSKKRRSKAKGSKRRKSHKRRNPAYQFAYKTKDGKKKLAGTAKFPLKHEYEKKIENDPTVLRFKKMLAKAKDSGAKSMLASKIVNLKKIKAKKYIEDIAAKRKYIQRLEEEGAEIKSFIKGEKTVAKKKRKKRKASKKVAKKSTKRRTKRRKGSKRRKMSKAAKRAFVARMKAARKGKGSKKKASKRRHHKKAKRSKSRRRSKRRYPKMVAHKHSKSVRHIPKGSSSKISARGRKGRYKISAKFGRGKRKVRMSGSVRVTKRGLKGRVRINPFRRNPLKDLSAQTKMYLGLDAADLGSLALGGALVPVANGLVGKYVPTLASMVSQYVGPQAAGSVLPILLGIGLNAAAEHGVKNGPAHEYLKKAGEGLAAAGIIGLAMSLAQRYINPSLGLSGMGIMPTLNGINFTPGMRGINFTPGQGLRGINYTPGAMGIMPQLNGVDFGAANYGGGGGSKEARTQPSDFGAWDSADSEAEGLEDQDNSYSSSMN